METLRGTPQEVTKRRIEERLKKYVLNRYAMLRLRGFDRRHAVKKLSWIIEDHVAHQWHEYRKIDLFAEDGRRYPEMISPTRPVLTRRTMNRIVDAAKALVMSR